MRLVADLRRRRPDGRGLLLRQRVAAARRRAAVGLRPAARGRERRRRPLRRHDALRRTTSWAQFDCGFVMQERDELEIVGEEGSLFLDDPWHARTPGIEIRTRRQRRGARPPAGGLLPARAREPERRDPGRGRAAARPRGRRRPGAGDRRPVPLGRSGTLRSRSTDTKPARFRAPGGAIHRGWRSDALCSVSCFQSAASPAGPATTSSAPPVEARLLVLRGTLCGALRLSDRVAGRALRRVRRAAPRLRLGPCRRRLRGSRPRARCRLEGAGPAPRRRPGRRPRRRDDAAARGRRARVRARRRRPHRLARGEHRGGAGSRARQTLGAPRGEPARPHPARAAPARPLAGRAPGEHPGRIPALRVPSPAAVALVDDVYTTGATASAAARELKAAGARRVDVVTFARSVL